MNFSDRWDDKENEPVITMTRKRLKHFLILYVGIGFGVGVSIMSLIFG